jgi:hypothetical protein
MTGGLEERDRRGGAGKIEDDLWFLLWRIEFAVDGGEGAED